MNALEKTIYMASLYSLYSNLLSETQRDILYDYHLANLSISEIAENRHITRSAVNDALKKGTKKLLDLENNLHFAEKSQEMSTLLEKVKTRINDENLLDEISELEKKL